MAAVAPGLYRSLSGVFCIYKPAGRKLAGLIHGIKLNLANDLNALPCRPPRHIVEYTPSADDSQLPVVTSQPDLADHPLVVGPRYEPEDFDIRPLHWLTSQVCGVAVLGIGAGVRFLPVLKRAQHMSVYQLQCELGRATHDHTPEGRLLYRTTAHHVTHYKIDRVLAAMQAGHQKNQFQAAGVDPQSQEAYELAAQGLIRRKDKAAGPVIYNLKCIDFTPPQFTIEGHMIGEHTPSLLRLVHDLGSHVRSSAVATQVRRMRHGHFTLTHALLRKHWRAQHIAQNIKLCRGIVDHEQFLLDSDNVEKRGTLISAGEDSSLLSDGHVKHLPS